MTVDLDQNKKGEHAPDLREKIDVELVAAIQKAIQFEISNFYCDYGFFILGQIFGSVAMLVIKIIRPEYTYQGCAVTVFSVLAILNLIRALKRRSDSKLIRFIIVQEIICCLLLTAASVLYETRLFNIPMLLVSFIFLIQLPFTCMNLADSIDQIFMFKLVCPILLGRHTTKAHMQSSDIPDTDQTVRKRAVYVGQHTYTNMVTRISCSRLHALLCSTATVQVCGICVLAQKERRSYVYGHSVLLYLNATLFLGCQLTSILSVVISSQIIQKDFQENIKIEPLPLSKWILFPSIPLGILLTLSLVFALSHRILRQSIVSMSFEYETDNTDLTAGVSRPSQIKIKYPLFLV